MTRTDAVNRILRAANEHPVSDLGSETSNDTLMAEQILDEITKREQMTGQHVNTTETSFIPDSANNDRVALPDNTVQVKGWNRHTYRNFFAKEVTGLILLHDADEEPATFSFANDAEVFIRITQSLTFEELPLPHQFSVVDQAAVEYQQHVLGSESLNRDLQQRAFRSRAIARAHDMRSTPHSQFDDGRAQGPRAGARWTPRAWPWNSRIID